MINGMGILGIAPQNKTGVVMQNEQPEVEELSVAEVEHAIKVVAGRNLPSRYDRAKLSEAEVNEIVGRNCGYLEVCKNWQDRLGRVLEPDDLIFKLQKMLREREEECREIIESISKIH
jgi:hypothetical protein